MFPRILTKKEKQEIFHKIRVAISTTQRTDYSAAAEEDLRAEEYVINVILQCIEAGKLLHCTTNANNLPADYAGFEERDGCTYVIAGDFGNRHTDGDTAGDLALLATKVEAAKTLFRMGLIDEYWYIYRMKDGQYIYVDILELLRRQHPLNVLSDDKCRSFCNKDAWFLPYKTQNVWRNLDERIGGI